MDGEVQKVIPLFKHFVAQEAGAWVKETLDSSCIGQGPRVDEFEAKLKAWIGECVVVNSGSSALWLAYDLAGIREGDIVISTPITCSATNIPLAHMGADIRWADVDPETGIIDVDSVRALIWSSPSIQQRLKAIVAVDYGSHLADINQLQIIASNNGAKLILDAAHSFGAYRRIRPDFACYSFQAIKHLTTGDGGALVCQDRDRAILKRWFGLDRTKGGFRCDQEITELGYKFHMTDIAASIGLANLEHVSHNIGLHVAHAIAYNQSRLGYGDTRSSCWMYNIKVKDRDQFVAKMAECGVQCARTHARNDRHPIFIDNRAVDPLPGVTEYDNHQVSIPVGWWLSGEDVLKVISSVEECR